MTAPHRKPQIIFSLLGGMLLAISFLLAMTQPSSEAIKFWSDALQEASFVILTLVIVDFLWQVLGGEPVRETLKALGTTLSEMREAVLLLEDSKETGLQRLFPVSSVLGTREWMQRLKGSKHNVDLMGYSLHVWTRGANFEDEMRAIVKAGVHVRVLIMEESNTNLNALVNVEQIAALSINSVVEEIKVARRVFKGIADSLQGTNPIGSFEFRVLPSGLIVTQICRTDSRLTAVQYLYSVVASRSPLVDVYGPDSGLFRVYMNEFESLWKLGILG